MKSPLFPGEWMVRDGAANMWRGAEAVGGHLYLTSWRLVFESHAFNIQTGSSIAPRDAITHVGPFEKKLFGLIAINNHMVVRLRDGGEAVFVVNDREGWMRTMMAR